MANEEQLAILRQGVEAWNKWRKENPNIQIDLYRAELGGYNLVNINLNRAILDYADLRRTVLTKANLTEANLKAAHLRIADLRTADLRRVILSEARLLQADLTGADLSGAILHGTDLIATNFAGTNLDMASLKGSYTGRTIFTAVDLSRTHGLETIEHTEPSSIGIDTIHLSSGKIPIEFLRGCGLSDADIESAKLSNPNLTNEEINNILYKIYDFRAGQALQISPLFISYSHADSIFVERLENHLNSMGIRFWRDVHDAKAGRLEKQISRAIRLNPTVLLILSLHSLKSDWVEHEVRTARELEKEMGRDVLCLVALDDSWKNSRWPKRVMEQVTEYNILDFSMWQDDSKFGTTFNKLIDGLELFYKGK